MTSITSHYFCLDQIILHNSLMNTFTLHLRSIRNNNFVLEHLNEENKKRIELK